MLESVSWRRIALERDKGMAFRIEESKTIAGMQSRQREREGGGLWLMLICNTSTWFHYCGCRSGKAIIHTAVKHQGIRRHCSRLAIRPGPRFECRVGAAVAWLARPSIYMPRIWTTVLDRVT
jgi:hypothetical protein